MKSLLLILSALAFLAASVLAADGPGLDDEYLKALLAKLEKDMKYKETYAPTASPTYEEKEKYDKKDILKKVIMKKKEGEKKYEETYAPTASPTYEEKEKYDKKDILKKVIMKKKEGEKKYEETDAPTASPTYEEKEKYDKKDILKKKIIIKKKYEKEPTYSPTYSPTPAPTKKIYKKVTKKECYFELVGNGFCRTNQGWKPRHKTVCEGGTCNLKECKKMCFDDYECQGIEYNPGRNCELHMTSVDFVKESTKYDPECHRLVCKVKQLKYKKELYEPEEEEEYYPTEKPTPFYEPEEEEKPDGIKKAILKKFLAEKKY